jgi:hypothetical protein
MDLHANFALAANGESIGIFTPSGVLVDSVTFGPQSTDISQGRFPDGSAVLAFMPVPTPRASNTLDSGDKDITVNLDGGNIVLSFAATSGNTYRVLYVDSLTPPIVWLPLGPDRVATGATLTVTDSIGTQPQRYYRIQELP